MFFLRRKAMEEYESTALKNNHSERSFRLDLNGDTQLIKTEPWPA